MQSVDADFKEELRATLEGQDSAQKAIQIDCRFWIQQAMFRAGCQRKSDVHSFALLSEPEMISDPTNWLTAME